jgi:tetratricopeptide (TPR) repeat protein
LEPGDYRVVFRTAGCLDQALTVAARRGRVIERSLALVPRASLGALAPELVALPGGQSPQLGPLVVFSAVEPCLLGRTEVTLEAWYSYLLHVQLDSGRWLEQLALDRRAPACLLTQPEASAYASWLEGEALLYGLRARLTLPSLHQLAFAARGELDWPFPWGALYDDAFVGRVPEVPLQSPPVGTQVWDCSPLGVRDLAGSVTEFTRQVKGSVAVLFGGEQLGGEISNRVALGREGAAFMTDTAVNLGFRIVVELDQPPQATLPEPDPRKAAALAQQALQLAQAGRLVDGLGAATQALRHDVGNAALFKLRADLRSAAGDTYGAYLDVTQATLLAPEDPQAWEGLGTVQRMRQAWQAAEVAFTRALERDAKRAAALLERGQLRERRQDLPGARDDFQRWWAVARPDDPARSFVRERLTALKDAFGGR